MDVTRERAHQAWRTADRIKQLSDGLVGIGPFKLGIDGVLAWVPVAGTLYSVGAGALLISEAIQAGAARATILRMGAYLAADSVSSGVPILGWAFDTLFTGHAMAARALQRDIEARHGKAETPAGGKVPRGGMRDVTPERRRVGGKAVR